MKTRIIRSVLALAMMAMALPMMGQDYVNVNLKNGEVSKFFLDDVSKIYTSKTDANGVQRSDYQFQYITTADGDAVYDLDDIESLTFVKDPYVPAEPIDLGLPSGTKWASYNVGASKPEEYGGYYAWGETEEKEVYNQDTYKYYQNGKYVSLGDDISGTEYDVAHVKWGGDWVMPTFDDLQELLANCDYEWTTLNDVNGMKFTSKTNGNSIFLPATGYRWGGDLYRAGGYGYCWSSTQNPEKSDETYYLYFYLGVASWGHGGSHSGGQSVRPVIKPEPPEVPAEPIDLGLPSKTKWASCNVGATKPEEYGGYYAWGETEEKEVYSQDTYKYYQNGEYVSLGDDISGTEYDVAHVTWGGDWVMPTKADIKELFANCDYEWTTLNDVKGMKFISKTNGNSIFLPAAGLRWDGDLREVGEYGGYWSSTQNTDDPELSFYLYIGSGEANWYSRYWCVGQSVRPVIRN